MAEAHAPISVRTTARALEGMQKEALVNYGPSGITWRMVCDEGPYLNGTDLAPFPLAFFCAGMVASYMSELKALLDKNDIGYSSLRLLQDNYYSMEGSAVAGTMTGSALPVELLLEVDCDANTAQLNKVLADAVAAAPVGALLATTLENTFSIHHNQKALVPDRVGSCDALVQAPSDSLFENVAPAASPCGDELISKLRSTEVIQGVSGGAGTSLADHQKRVLHMRGVCTLLPDGMKEIVVELYKPIGSQFRFLSDDSSTLGGQDRAPCGLSYLNAGIAFCFLTQIGRYAHIKRKPLQDYLLVQDMYCSQPGATGGTGKAAEMQALQTHVWLASEHDDSYARTVVDMSEQTCFLHAACRMPVKVRLKSTRD